MEVTARGLSGGSRQSVAAAAAALVRTGVAVLTGTCPPSDADLETSERMQAIRTVVKRRVEAGTGGHLASIPGGHRRARNRAEHHAFGAGPGLWQRDPAEAAATAGPVDFFIGEAMQAVATQTEQVSEVGDEASDTIDNKSNVEGEVANSLVPSRKGRRTLQTRRRAP